MSLPTLVPVDFPAVFEAIHGYRPFPWQSRLVEALASDPAGAWPAVLALPTGSGKTAALDGALFQLALQAEAGAARTAPLRIAFVVDRRVIVDEAFERAERIAAALAESKGRGPLARMAAVGLPVLAGAAVQRRGRTRFLVLGADYDADGQIHIGWPIWDRPASLAAIRSLLAHPALAVGLSEERDRAELERLGVTGAYRAERISVGKYFNFSRGL